mgnify:CR=1 FL=1
MDITDQDHQRVAAAIKAAEATLGAKYRRINDDGTVSGGPMYYLRDGLAEQIGGSAPAGAQGQRDLVGLDPGALAQGLGGALGELERVGLGEGIGGCGLLRHGAGLQRRDRCSSWRRPACGAPRPGACADRAVDALVVTHPASGLGRRKADPYPSRRQLAATAR